MLKPRSMKNEAYLNNTIQFCIVEDDPVFRDQFALMLEKFGKVRQIASYREAIHYLRTHRPDMLFIDMELDGVKDGPKIVEQASSQDIHCVVVSGHDDEDLIKECIDKGAKDYFVKSDVNTTLKDIIAKYKRLYKKPTNSEFLYTNHPQFKQNLEFLLGNAKTEFPILLSGPTGSGKTFFAKQLHMKSELKGPFVQVNCSAIPKELFESEMFGHEKGAFSGAVSKYNGKIAEANGGTLYLDELDSMPLEQQAKLLKVIEEKEFSAVGSNKVQKSNFRLICSAQKDLKKMIEEGRFREDLYYRISLIETRIPTLAERNCDIVPLLKNMLNGPRRFYFTSDFREYIEAYPWNGNLRELQIFASTIIMVGESKLTERLAHSILNRNKQSESLLNEAHFGLVEKVGLNEFMKMVEKEVLSHFHEKNNSNLTKTGANLKLPWTTVKRKWEQYESKA